MEQDITKETRKAEIRELIEKRSGKGRTGGCKTGCHKLDSFDWLQDLTDTTGYNDVVMIRFKNTRKEFYHNSNALKLKMGEIVAVEASPGHDIGVVALTGEIVKQKLIKDDVDFSDLNSMKKVYRKAKPVDIEKWNNAIDLEHSTMIKSRQISADLKLDMKIGDVEYQGDKTKAIFYYIADDRVDFRQLIKVLAEEFKVRIEMRQIGARQEAGRIGGIGSCGRELCCSSWMTNFNSVTTSAARQQEVSLNPQKLAGQCGKLKCCLNYELDAYIDAQTDFPDTNIELKIGKGIARHAKTDVFRRLMWYSVEMDERKSLTCMSVEQVKDIVAMNAKGKVPDEVKGIQESAIASVIEYTNSVGAESLTRFEDKPVKKQKSAKKPHHKKRRRPQGQQGQEQGQPQNQYGKGKTPRKNVFKKKK